MRDETDEDTRADTIRVLLDKTRNLASDRERERGSIPEGEEKGKDCMGWEAIPDGRLCVVLSRRSSGKSRR